jgi:hypothetical protein
MAKEKSLVEDALLQMRNLEEAVSQNAKGILASTMKQEIKELVKESIVSEQDDDDEEIDTEVDMDMDSDEEEMDMDMDSDEDEMEMDIDSDEDEMEMDADMDMDMGDDEVIDLSDEDSISDDDLLKVFMAMGEKDGIIVKKDDDQIHLTDENKDSEYLIQMGESEEEEYEMYESDEEEMDESDDDDIDSIISKVFDEGETVDVDDEEVVYEIEMDSDEEEMYEQEDEEEMYEQEDEDEMDFDVNESMKPKIGKGAKIGKPSKFSYKTSKGGFKESMKTGTKGVGMGKVKSTIFNKPVKKETKEGAMMGKGKPSSTFKSKEETKEASRTLGNGSMFRKGGLPKPRAHSKANISIEEQRNINQVQILREKNEEYRKALNVFRDKLNEVAIFNSNLAYATRLFTEHSTSKQEKINILRRFDGVETIKESKNLYKTIKEELSTKTKGSITESIETRIEKTPASGSASTLIESKTYENPQFLRMKDLMNKIIK